MTITRKIKRERDSMDILINIGLWIGVLIGVGVVITAVAGIGAALITHCIELIERWVEKHG